VILFSDEIYGELNFKGPQVSIARFYPEGTIISGGLSKWCGAGGWRLGTFTFPRSLSRLLGAMASVASETFTSTSAPIQFAAVTAFKGGIDMERYLWNSRKILEALGYKIHEMLTNNGIDCPKPDGAFYLFCNFTNFKEKLSSHNINSSLKLSARLLEDTGVALLPGCVFGRPEEELTTRLAYVDFEGARAMAAAETISSESPITNEFLSIHCSSILEAVEKIIGWLKSL
jgi:aspartate aminotransferase